MRRPTLFPLLLLLGAALLVPAEGRAAGEAPLHPLDARTRDFDQRHLAIHVQPDLRTGTVRGSVGISFASERDGLRRLVLHAEDMKVLSVTGADATPLPFEARDGVLAIDLGTPLARGAQGRVEVAYQARPTRGLYFHRPSDASPKTPLLCYSQGEGADNHHWFPCYDQPDDRFSWEVWATVPSSLETVSNGVLAESKDAGNDRRTDHWKFDGEAPSYLVSLIVADMDTVKDHWGDVTLEYNAPAGMGANLQASLGQTPAMMGFYSDWLDFPYPWGRYAQTFVWDFVYGGMENVTATTLHLRGLHGPGTAPNYDTESLAAHELAHSWFGDLITCRTFGDIWLNEGFATYMTDLWFEKSRGEDDFHVRLRQQNLDLMNGTKDPSAQGIEASPRGDRPLELGGGKAYSRGAAILHMLRLELGDALFQKAMRTYVQRHQNRDVTSEDFRRTVEDVAGRDLSWFFDQWVYGVGYPVLEVTYHPAAGRVDVRQVQARKGGQGLFRLTLPVRVGSDGAVVPLRIWQETQAFDVPPKGAWLRAGVGGDLLARIRISQSRQAWQACLAHDPDVTARLDAIDALEVYGADAVPALAAATTGDKSFYVRKAAVDALAKDDADSRAGAALLQATGDADARVREAAYEALGTRTRQEAGAALLRAVKEEPLEYPRSAAAHSLGRVHAEGAIDALQALLQVDSDDEVVRTGAIEGLQALGDPAGAALAEPFLAYRWGEGGTQHLREAALRCITHLRPDAPRTHDLLIRLLDDPHKDLRTEAATACGTYGVQRARHRLEKMAKDDPQGGVRAAAKRALEAKPLKDPKAFP